MMESKYNTLKEWRKSDPKAAIAAKKLNIINEICEMFGWYLNYDDFVYKTLISQYGFFTKEDCLVDALKYSSRGIWRVKSKKYYHISRALKWFNECTAHMSKEVWDYESCLAEAKLYPYNWGSMSPNSYGYANKKGFIEKICSEANIYDYKY